MVAEWLLTGTVATALVLALLLSSATSQLDRALYDGVLRLGGQPTPDDIIIVAIDDQSLEALGPWPWSRSVHARLLDRLAAAKPRVIAYDVLFLDPSAPSEDAALGRAVAAAGVVEAGAHRAARRRRGGSGTRDPAARS
jgi:CHASE2 domain-containing sensor protein